MHALIPPLNVHSFSCITGMSSHLSLNWKHDFLFSDGVTTFDNPLGTCPIVSLASPTTLIAVLLCLFVSSSTFYFFTDIGTSSINMEAFN